MSTGTLTARPDPILPEPRVDVRHELTSRQHRPIPAGRDTAAAPTSPGPARRPGWPEIAAAAIGYGVLVFLGVQVVDRIPAGRQVAVGLANYALSALAGIGAFAAAVAIKIRRPALFGLRRTGGKWILAGAGLGVVAFIISIVASYLFSTLSGNTENVQSGYQAAARGGTIALIATLLLGSVATPIVKNWLSVAC